ncbi:nuclear transport factor 2 family protein [Nocardia blacklockiae]|uniref:nuclear transport factor 2 family protein n=1 Tax=Nocardia blacklockiae TaxID=480036 RepID=UPI001894E7B6|nr:nuclear transport factor 2 family protein [Nocardia blacklockiae]MBF6171783.1 nuclear transport factor 2 family protein [Nocardia blacklockiae]
MDLVALEEIRALKYRYLRSLDTKQWDEFGSTLAEDATGDYGSPSGGGPLKFTGRDAIVDYMRKALDTNIITVHVGSHPEITVDGETATGSWCLEDTVIVPDYGVAIRGAAYYRDRYRKVDGRWHIAHTGYERLYEATIPLSALPGFTLTANRWAPAAS